MHEREVKLIPLGKILEPSHRLRENIDGERLGALADDMAANGLHQAIGLRGPLEGELWEIIWGHRRYLAAVLLRWPSIEAKLFPADYDPLLAAVMENNNREDMSPMDDARALQRFAERGEPLSAIARLWRRSPAWVHERLALLELPKDLQDELQDGELSLGVARALGAIDHYDYRQELIREAKRTGAKVTTVNIWIAHYEADKARIVQNLMTVQEIASRRENWKLKIACELCGEEVNYEVTRTIRGCDPCLVELARVIQAEAAKAQAEAAAESA